MSNQVIGKAALALFVLTAVMSASCRQEAVKKIDVFHKNKPPSLQTLERTKEVLQKHEADYDIAYHIIDNPENTGLLKRCSLPETHFPFAVVINGKYSASIDGRIVHFLEFPLFMRGIGRHEGNWSMEDLDKALDDNRLLLDENVLPESFHHEHAHEPCPGESH
jgi:hypothetical protein